MLFQFGQCVSAIHHALTTTHAHQHNGDHANHITTTAATSSRPPLTPTRQGRLWHWRPCAIGLSLLATQQPIHHQVG
ncbi:MAG: hypothetical protein AAF639_11375 [Chloroflexota bacterium]